MDKYIDREALIEWLKRIPLIDLSDGRGLCRVIMEDDFKKAIKKMPKGIIADVEPVRYGRWEPVLEGVYNLPTPVLIGWRCSQCGRTEQEKEPYCNCGAKMDEEVDHD